MLDQVVKSARAEFRGHQQYYETGEHTVSFWVKNIGNEEGVTGRYTEAYMGSEPSEGYYGNGSKDLISLPRTVGATLGFRF